MKKARVKFEHGEYTPMTENLLARTFRIEFKKGMIEQVCKEFREEKLEVLLGKSGKDCLATAAYQTSKTHIFLVLLHTIRGERCKGFGHALVNKLKSQHPDKKLVLETKKHSWQHAIFEKMGFRSVSANEFDGAETAIRCEKRCSPVILEYNSESLSGPPKMEHLHRISKQLEASGHSLSMHVTHVEKSVENLKFGKNAWSDNAWSRMQNELPNLIDFEMSWFVRLAGMEYFGWLCFQIHKMRMEVWKEKQCNDKRPSRFKVLQLAEGLGYQVNETKPGQDGASLAEPKVSFIDLVLLNYISHVSGLLFVPVALDAQGDMVAFEQPLAESFPQEVSKMYILPTDWKKPPKFLLTPNVAWVLGLLPSSVVSEAKNPKIIRELVQWLAPQPSVAQATRESVSCQHGSVTLSIPTTTTTTTTTTATATAAATTTSTTTSTTAASRKKSREDGLVVFSCGSICPSLLAMGSGIAMTNDWKLCHSPMPSINRGLGPNRFKEVMPRIEEGYKSEQQGEGMKEQFSLFPYKWSSTEGLHGSNWDLQDPAAFQMNTLVGNLKAAPLDAESIQKLAEAFGLKIPMKEAGAAKESSEKAETANKPSTNAITVNHSKLLQEPEGRLELLSLIFHAIQDEMQMFAAKESFQKLLNHLLVVWQGQQQEQGQEQLIDICRYSSTAGCFLLIKMLWVALEFPVIAPVEGLARLYCANDLLLAHMCANEEGFVPPGLIHAGPNVDLVGVSSMLTFSETTSVLVSKYAFKAQDRMSGITRTSLQDVLLLCCRAIKLNSEELQKVFQTAHNKVWMATMKSQAEKLAEELEGMRKRNKGGFVDQHFGVGTDEIKGWRAKVQNLRWSSKISHRVPFAVMVFRFMLVPLHITFDKKKIVCKTPFESISNFISANGGGDPEGIWWLPDADKHKNGQNGSLSWLVRFEQTILQTLLDLMAGAFAATYLEEEGATQAQKKQRLTFQNCLKVWLQSYLLELVTWGGMNIAMPEHFKQQHEDSQIRFLFHPMTTEPKMQKNTENKQRSRQIEDLSSLAILLSQCQNKTFCCNLFGVVTYVLLYIKSTNDTSCVQGFEINTAASLDLSIEDFDQLIQKACPLFNGKNPSDKRKKWSLFELTKWLLGDSAGALKAANSVKDAWNACQRDGIGEQLGHFVKRGILDTKDLFIKVLAGGMREQHYCTFKEEMIYMTCKEPVSNYPTVWDPESDEVEFYLFSKLSLGWMFIGNVPKAILDPVVKHCETQRYKAAFEKMNVMQIWHLGGQGGTKKKDRNGKLFMSSDVRYHQDECEMKLLEKVVAGLCGIRDHDVERIQDIVVQSFGTVGHVDSPLPAKKVKATHSTPKQRKGKEEEEEDDNHRGFLCVMPLDEAGCTFHLHVQEKEAEPVEVKVVYIPFGFILVFDDKEYRGGHYAPENQKKTFICRIGTESSSSDEQDLCLQLVCTPACDVEKFPVTMQVLNDKIEGMQKGYTLQREDNDVGEAHKCVGMGESKVAYQLEEILGSLPAYACDFLPAPCLRQVIQIVESVQFRSEFEKRKKLTEYKDWSTCVSQSQVPTKGAYYEFGGNLYELGIASTHGRTRGLSAQLEKHVAELLTQIEVDEHINPGLDHRAYMLISTLEPSHQVYHVDYPTIFNKANVGRRAFLCFIPLAKTGYTIRLAKLQVNSREKLKKAMETANKLNLEFFQVDEKVVLEEHVYVHVPFGSAFIIDIREFHGGHYINKNDLCLLCVLSSFAWGDSSPKNHAFTFLRRFLPHPRSKAAEVHHPRYWMEMQNRVEYNKKFKKENEAEAKESKSTKVMKAKAKSISANPSQSHLASTALAAAAEDKTLDTNNNPSLSRLASTAPAAAAAPAPAPATEAKKARRNNVDGDGAMVELGGTQNKLMNDYSGDQSGAKLEVEVLVHGKTPPPEETKSRVLTKTNPSLSRLASTAPEAKKARRNNVDDNGAMVELGLNRNKFMKDYSKEANMQSEKDGGTNGPSIEAGCTTLLSLRTDFSKSSTKTSYKQETRGKKREKVEDETTVDKWCLYWDNPQTEIPSANLWTVIKPYIKEHSHHHVAASSCTVIVTKGGFSTTHRVTGESNALAAPQTYGVTVTKEQSRYLQEYATINKGTNLSSILVLREHSVQRDEKQEESLNCNDAVSFIRQRGKKVSTIREEANGVTKWSFRLHQNEAEPCDLEWLHWPFRYLWQLAKTNPDRDSLPSYSEIEFGFTAFQVDLYQVKEELIGCLPDPEADSACRARVTAIMILPIFKESGPTKRSEQATKKHKMSTLPGTVTNAGELAAKKPQTSDLPAPTYYLVITFLMDDFRSLFKDLGGEYKAVKKMIKNERGLPMEKIVADLGTQFVSVQGFQTLEKQTWLNDEIITCYASLLMQQNNKEMCKLHIYPTYFYQKLTDSMSEGKDCPNIYTEKLHEMANKSVPNNDIFRLEKIIVPMNLEGTHWVCTVIYIQQKVIEVYDSIQDVSREVHTTRLLWFLQQYHKKTKSAGAADFNTNDWDVKRNQNSPQHNDKDCGVFACIFLEFLSLGITEVPTFTPEEINVCRLKIGLALLNGKPMLSPVLHKAAPILGPFLTPSVPSDSKLKHQPVFFKSGLSLRLHKQFASLLIDNEKFEKGSPYGDLGVSKMPATSHSDAKFYFGDKFQPGTKVRLLDDGHNFGTLGRNVHKLDDEPFKQLFDFFSSHGFSFNMMTIRKSDKMNVISGFKPHKDKVYFEKGVAFVSLGVPFWTVIDTNQMDPNDSTEAFKEWSASVDEDQLKVLNDFMKQFNSECCSIYHCTATTVLAFKACNLKHGTIIPASHNDRYVCILNELVQVKGATEVGPAASLPPPVYRGVTKASRVRRRPPLRKGESHADHMRRVFSGIPIMTASRERGSSEGGTSTDSALEREKAAAAAESSDGATSTDSE